jgi:3-oxoacyl-[acyl-carrier protein] reductase
LQPPPKHLTTHIIFKGLHLDLGLAGASAVVTGGSKGMGLAIAECIAAEGASVAIMARGESALDSAVERLRSVGAPDALGISVDMSDPASIDAGFAAVAEKWDTLNVLVHTVGPPPAAFEDLDDAGWQTAFDLGTMSAVRSVRLALPMLRAASWSRIVTLSAHSIQRQSPGLVAYTASKAALSSLTKNLAKSLAPEGILVNCVCPGTIVTASFTEDLRDVLAADGLDAADPHDVMRWVEQTFHHPCDLGRAGSPDEIASVTTYLASRRNGYVTGATVNVDGGSNFI